MQIYALIRTRNRKEKFLRCLTSIKRSHIHITPIVAWDYPTKPTYIPDGILSFQVKAEIRNDCFYNLFCNDLMDKIEGMPPGYFFFLDDDDYIFKPSAMSKIVPHLTEDKGLICQFGRGRNLKPNAAMIQTKQIISGKIGLPCLILHTKHRNVARLGNQSYSDWEWISEINSKIGCNFVQQQLVMSPSRSYGQ